jgi:hypothetical protein
VSAQKPRFPCEQGSWGTPEERQRWREALEQMGVPKVRAYLAGINVGPRASISIGTEENMIVGFARDWIAWHEQQGIEREQRSRRTDLALKWGGFLIAAILALAGFIGWLTGWW